MNGHPAGTLFVLATPIGNLEDITLRALRILKEVAVVAAEDTRRTGNLLRHYGITTSLVSLHEHNEHQRATELVRRLQQGDSVAVVSDAGTPGISDPGARLVRFAREAGVRVDPIPGASAITAVLSASGLFFERFAFAGFPPTGSKDRKEWFQWVSHLDDVPVVCFEAPHRVVRTLKEAAEYFGVRPIVVARELTKVHEEWYFADAVTAQGIVGEPQGEFVVIIGPAPPAENAKPIVTDAEIAALFGQLTVADSPTRRAAVKSVAERLSLPVRAVYAALERAKSTEGSE